MAKRKVAERWYTIAEMAGFIGLSAPAFRALHISMGCPHQEKRGEAKTSPIFINSKRWLEVWRGDARSKVEETEAEIKQIELEMARLKLGEMAGRLIDYDDFWLERLGPFCDRLRRAIESLEQISPPAFSRMMEGLDSACEAMGVQNEKHTTNGHATNGKVRDKGGSGGSARAGARANASGPGRAARKVP